MILETGITAIVKKQPSQFRLSQLFSLMTLCAYFMCLAHYFGFIRSVLCIIGLFLFMVGFFFFVTVLGVGIAMFALTAVKVTEIVARASTIRSW